MTIAISIEHITKTALALSALETALDRENASVLTADNRRAIEQVGTNLMATIPIDLYPFIVDISLNGDVLTMETGHTGQLGSGAAAAIRMALEQAATEDIMAIVTGNDSHTMRQKRYIDTVRRMLKGAPGACGPRKFYL